MQVPRIRSVLATLLALTFIVAVLPAASADTPELIPGGDPTAEAAKLAPGVPFDILLRNDASYRRALGFRYDDEYITSLYAHPELTTDTREWGALFTPAEAAEERLRREDLTADTEASRAWLLDHGYSDAIGGTFIDHEAGGKVVVALTRDVEAAQLALSAIVRHPERLIVRQAHVTQKALDDAMNHMDYEPIVAKTGEVYSAGVDIKNERILMVVADPDTANRTNAGASVGVPVWFVSGTRAVPQDNRNDDAMYVPPYKAGHGIKQWPCGNFACDWKGHACTMGFAAKLPDGINDGAFTAGHCTYPTPPDTLTYNYISHHDHYPKYIGKPAGSVVWDQDEVDVYAYSAVAGKTTAPYALMNWPSIIPVIATDAGHEQVGYTRIKSGRTTAYGAGVLYSTNWDRDGSGGRYTARWRLATYQSDYGDSGMPVWHPLNSYAWASGVNFGKTTINGTAYAVYSHISYVLLRTGYTLKTTF